MFTTEHFIWIGLCAVAVTAMSIISVKRKLGLKTVGLIMVGVCALSEVSKVMCDMVASLGGGMHLNPLSLPLHLCSMMIFVALYITFGKEGKFKQVLINFIAVAGIVGGFCAIMIPTNGTDFTTILAYQCFVYHSGLMWFSLYLILTGRAKLGSIKSLVTNLGIICALSFGMIYVNGMLSVYDTNFFYLTRPPMENLPYLNLDHGWYIYFIRLLLLGVVLISLFHLPFILKENRHE